MALNQDTNTKKRAFKEDRPNSNDSISTNGINDLSDQVQPSTRLQKPGLEDDDVNDLEMMSSPEIVDINVAEEEDDDDEEEDEEDDDDDDNDHEVDEVIAELDAIGELGNEVQIVDGDGDVVEVTDNDSANLDNHGRVSSIKPNVRGQQQIGQPKTYPLANDFDALAAKLMKPIEDYPVEESTLCVGDQRLGPAIEAGQS